MKNVNAGDIVKIVQKYSGFIKNCCRKYYIEGGTNEDLYQEGIIGLLEACNNYKGESLFETRFDCFVKICIRCQIYDAIRKANSGGNVTLNQAVPIVSKKNENGEELSILDIFDDRTTISDPLELFIDKEKFYEIMERCRRELSEFENLVLDHYLTGEKQSEIAKNLNKSVKSIDNTLQRIKSKLK